MNVTASLAAGVSYPIATTALGWQGTLSIWLVFIIIAIIVWLPQTKKTDHVNAANLSGKPPKRKFGNIH